MISLDKNNLFSQKDNHSSIKRISETLQKSIIDKMEEVRVNLFRKLEQSKPKDLQGIRDSEKINEGGYGNVFLSKENNSFVVIKQNDSEEMNLREKEIMWILNHQNIVKLINDPNLEKSQIKMEFCEFSSLDNYLRINQRKRVFDEENIFYIFNQIVLGLIYLQEQGIVHLDLKPQNILISEKTIKIGDFGISQFIQEKEIKHQGSLFYREKNALENDHKIDIYSLGIILYELIDDFETYSEKVKNIVKIQQQQFEDKEVFKLIKRLISEKRPSAVEIFQTKEYLQWAKSLFFK